MTMQLHRRTRVSTINSGMTHQTSQDRNKQKEILTSEKIDAYDTCSLFNIQNIRNSTLLHLQTELVDEKEVRYCGYLSLDFQSLHYVYTNVQSSCCIRILKKPSQTILCFNSTRSFMLNLRLGFLFICSVMSIASYRTKPSRSMRDLQTHVHILLLSNPFTNARQMKSEKNLQEYIFERHQCD